MRVVFCRCIYLFCRLICFCIIYFFFFFFQAEDGIRDLTVTGVQTCALPICPCSRSSTGAACRTCESTPRITASTRVDRKSTRLNSSHSQISYAVFCLKKKKTKFIPSPNSLTFQHLRADSDTAGGTTEVL